MEAGEDGDGISSSFIKNLIWAVLIAVFLSLALVRVAQTQNDSTTQQGGGTETHATTTPDFERLGDVGAEEKSVKPEVTDKTAAGMAANTPSYARGEILALIRQYDWNHDVAIAVMLAESGGNPNALNNNPKTKDYSVGLFQINIYGSLAKARPDEEWLRQPDNNIAYAYQLFKAAGWSPWSVCKTRIKCY